MKKHESSTITNSACVTLRVSSTCNKLLNLYKFRRKFPRLHSDPESRSIGKQEKKIIDQVIMPNKQLESSDLLTTSSSEHNRHDPNLDKNCDDLRIQLTLETSWTGYLGIVKIRRNPPRNTPTTRNTPTSACSNCGRARNPITSMCQNPECDTVQLSTLSMPRSMGAVPFKMTREEELLYRFYFNRVTTAAAWIFTGREEAEQNICLV